MSKKVFPKIRLEIMNSGYDHSHRLAYKAIGLTSRFLLHNEIEMNYLNMIDGDDIEKPHDLMSIIDNDFMNHTDNRRVIISLVRNSMRDTFSEWQLSKALLNTGENNFSVPCSNEIVPFTNGFDNAEDRDYRGTNLAEDTNTDSYSIVDALLTLLHIVLTSGNSKQSEDIQLLERMALTDIHVRLSIYQLYVNILARKHESQIIDQQKKRQ